MPSRLHERDAVVFSGVHCEPVAFQSPSLQRNCSPVWQDMAPSENMAPFKKQLSFAARAEPGTQAIIPASAAPNGSSIRRMIFRFMVFLLSFDPLWSLGG